MACRGALFAFSTVVLALAASADKPSEREALMGKWTRSCALCHVEGTGGAPRVGVAEEWRARVAKGEATLLEHTIEGYNNMPPLGYCMSCDEGELRALIRFMSSGGEAAAREPS